MTDDDWIWSGIMEPRMMLFLTFSFSLFFVPAAVHTGWYFMFFPEGNNSGGHHSFPRTQKYRAGLGI